MMFSICETKQQMTEFVRVKKRAGQRVALVPTMGNLHDGHLHLVKQAQQVADCVVVSIFVNPLQFDREDDLARYPRTWDEDLAKLTAVGVNAVLYPSAEHMYPNGMAQISKVQVPWLSEILEGEHRPGHFDGVTTVVSKLFHWVQPDVAVFGKKDYQQLRIIQTMVLDLDFPIDILSVETQRASSGLALSSRNGLLSAEKLKNAENIHQILKHCKSQRLGGASCDTVEQQGEQALRDAGFRPEYLVVRRQSDLQIPSVNDHHLVVLVAAWTGDVRLIDNIEIDL